MEHVLCKKHGKPCMLKTGIKPGANQGKSFYICAVLADQCGFVQEASVSTMHCLQHAENIVDLQAKSRGKVSGEERHYYRCQQRNGKNWCGYATITLPQLDKDNKFENQSNPSSQIGATVLHGNASTSKSREHHVLHQDKHVDRHPQQSKQTHSAISKHLLPLDKHHHSGDEETNIRINDNIDVNGDRNVDERVDKGTDVIRNKIHGASRKTSSECHCDKDSDANDNFSSSIKDTHLQSKKGNTLLDFSSLSSSNKLVSDQPSSITPSSGSSNMNQYRDSICISDDNDESEDDSDSSDKDVVMIAGDQGINISNVIDKLTKQPIAKARTRPAYSSTSSSDSSSDEINSINARSLVTKNSDINGTDVRRPGKQSHESLHAKVVPKPPSSASSDDSSDESFQTADSQKTNKSTVKRFEDRAQIHESVRAKTKFLSTSDTSSSDDSNPSVGNSQTVTISSANSVNDRKVINKAPENLHSKPVPQTKSKSSSDTSSMNTNQLSGNKVEIPDCDTVHKSHGPNDSNSTIFSVREASSLSMHGKNTRVAENQAKSLHDVSSSVVAQKNVIEKSSAPIVKSLAGDNIVRTTIPEGKISPENILKMQLSARENVVQKLEKYKKTVATVKMGALPDKGEKLRREINELQQQLSRLDLTISNGQTQQIKQVAGGAGNTTLSYASETHQSGIRPLGGHGLAGGGGGSGGMKQTSILPHAQPLPPHILQQMYAANPQLHSLYGGRMTEARLREVGSVTQDAIERIHKQLETRPSSTTEECDPDGLQVKLMVHQRQALSWLRWRENQHPCGGILADDMGLGKTLTMIALVLKQMQQKKDSDDVEPQDCEDGDKWLNKDKDLKKLDKNIVNSHATLVVCPASVIHQWNKEIEKRCSSGMIKVLLYHGPDRERNLRKLAQNDIVLTTYNIVSREVGPIDDKKEAEVPAKDGGSESQASCHPESQPNLLRIGWERIILDEGHSIKNHKSKTAVAVCRLRAGCRWILTGTPIQNDLLDFYSLLRFLRCSPFDEYKVWKRQVDIQGQSGKTRLSTLVKSLLLRRTKGQMGAEGKPLVPLPVKKTETYELELSPDEWIIYQKIFKQSRSTFQDYLKRFEDKAKGISSNDRPYGGSGFYNSNTGSSVMATGTSGGLRGTTAGLGLVGAQGGSQPIRSTHILVMLLRLRQCCSHLSLLKDAIEDESLQSEGIELNLEEQMKGLLLEELDDGTQEPVLSKSSIIFDIATTSTKITFVLDKLCDIRTRSTLSRPLKSVIVSQWTKMLEIVAYHLKKAGFRYSLIQGNIAPKKRMEYVEDFNTNPKGPEVMLVSLRAGGVGLNLIGGSNLFLLDHHWNPALEEQASDRIYRVGQKNDVFIHRFLCMNTVEEKIVELQKRKTNLARDVLTGSGVSSQKLTLADLKMLFGV